MTDSYRDFIEMVLGSMTGNAIMGLRDRPGPSGKVNRYTSFRYPEELDKMVEFAADHKNEDLYMSPLVYGEDRTPEGKIRRTPENALMSNTIYQDSDTCKPENFRLRPSIHVTSSTGRYQDYWVLDEPIDAHEAANISRKIAIAHRADGSDPSSWSANKVLRIPHSTNTSHGFPEEVTVDYSGEVFSDMDVEGAYDDIQLEERAIMRLPADVSYEEPQDLPDYRASFDKLPENFVFDTLTKQVPDGVDRSRMRYRLLMDLFRVQGLTFEEVLSLAWFAPASSKWREDSRNIRGLIAEALKAQAEALYESGMTTEAPALETRSWMEEEAELLPLLTDEERAEISGDENWIETYCKLSRSNLTVSYNEPYSRLNAWMLLSAAFIKDAYMDINVQNRHLNFYGMAVGPSSSGKSSAQRLWRSVMKIIFPEDSGWNQGGDTSPEALHRNLIDRDKKITVLNADEAHGFFAALANPRNMGMVPKLALFFDGEVPPMHRQGDRDISGKEAECYFSINLCGTSRGKLSLPATITPEMWASGFLARFIWYIGNEPHTGRESYNIDLGARGGEKRGFGDFGPQWVAEFNSTRKRLKIQANKIEDGMFPVRFTSEIMKRTGDASWKAAQYYAGYKDGRYYDDMLEPFLRRLQESILRAASLLALSEGTADVGMRHTLLAIQEAETWVNSAVRIAIAAEGTEWTKIQDRLEKYLNKRKGRARRETVFNQFKEMKGFEFDMLVQSLVGQGRAIEENVEGVKWLVLKD